MSGPDVPDQSGRTMVITGGNSGIGLEAGVALARAGARVVITSRNEGRGTAAVERIRRRSGNDTAEMMTLDLASFASIRSFASALHERLDRVDVLLNNAGGILSDKRRTAEGFEMTFGVNHLGHFLLTSLVLDQLRDGAPSRIVNVSSLAHRFARGGLTFSDLDYDRRSYNSVSAYNESKLANVLFTKGLARRLDGSGITPLACHPGPVRSGFGRDDDTKGFERLLSTLSQPFLIGPRRGSDPLVYAATAPELTDRSGAYVTRWPTAFFPGGPRVRRVARQGRDPQAAEQLWEISEKLVEEGTG